MDKKFWLDSIFATLFIFFLIWLFGNITQFQIFDAFDPVGDALEDMEMSDVAFSQIREDPMPDTNIVIVNVGFESRAITAQQLEIIARYEPKVIGIDTFFPYRKPDTLQDIMLAQTLEQVSKNVPVVMVTKLIQSDSLYEVAAGEMK